MAASSVFIGVPKTWVGQVSVLNTAVDGTGTIATIVSAGSNGSRIDRVRVVAQQTTSSASQVRLFLHDGTINRMLKEIPLDAVTHSATVEPANNEITFPDGLVLPNGWSLRAAVTVGHAVSIFALGGDF